MILFKSILVVVPIYWLSLVLIPTSVMNTSRKKIYNFMWGSDDLVKKFLLCNWEFWHSRFFMVGVTLKISIVLGWFFRWKSYGWCWLVKDSGIKLLCQSISLIKHYLLGWENHSSLVEGPRWFEAVLLKCIIGSVDRWAGRWEVEKKLGLVLTLFLVWKYGFC